MSDASLWKDDSTGGSSTYCLPLPSRSTGAIRKVNEDQKNQENVHDILPEQLKDATGMEAQAFADHHGLAVERLDPGVRSLLQVIDGKGECVYSKERRCTTKASTSSPPTWQLGVSLGCICRSPALSPVLNSENPSELFEDLPDSCMGVAFKEDAEFELGAAGVVDAKHWTGTERPGVSSKLGIHRKWWNALYRAPLIADLAGYQHSVHLRRWLHEAKYAILQVCAFAVYVLLNANENLVRAASKKHLDGEGSPRDFPYAPSSVLLVASVISVSGGSLLALLFEGFNGLRRCWVPAALLRMAPISLLFQFGAVLKFASLRYLTADLVALLAQMNLIFLAVALCIVLRRRYRLSQWLNLMTTLLAMFQYLGIRGAHRHREMPQGQFLELCPRIWRGISIIFVMCMAETVASVLAEHYYKTKRDRDPCPFHIQKVHIDFSGLILSALWCYVIEPFVLKDLDWSCKPERCKQVLDKGLFSGWDNSTLVVLVLVVLKTWFAGIVATVLDSVVKQLGSCIAMVLTYIEVLWFYPHETVFDMNMITALALVVMGIASFAVSTRDSNQMEQLRKAGAPVASKDWARHYLTAPTAAQPHRRL